MVRPRGSRSRGWPGAQEGMTIAEDATNGVAEDVTDGRQARDDKRSGGQASTLRIEGPLPLSLTLKQA